MNYLEKKKESLMKRSPNIIHITENDAYPIHLRNCIDQSLRISKIYGKSSQANDPTDLNPVFIESVGFKNLFDSMQLYKASATVYGSYHGKDNVYCTTTQSQISATGTKSEGIFSLFGDKSTGYKLQLNKHVLTASIEAKNKTINSPKNTTGFMAMYSDNTKKLLCTINSTDWKKYSDTTNKSNITNIYAQYNYSDTVYMRNIQIEETDIVTDYTPFVRKRDDIVSEELFDPSWLLECDGWTNTNGVYSGTVGKVYSKYGYDDYVKNGFPISVGALGEYERIEISYEAKNSTKNVNTGGLAIVYSDDKVTNLPITNSTQWKRYNLCSAMGKTIKAIYFVYFNSDTVSLRNITVKKHDYGRIITDGIYKLPISVMSKNLVPLITPGSYATNGITFTRNSDNSLTINGTATANAIYYYNYPNSPIYLRKGEKYYLYNSGYSHEQGIITYLQSTNYKQAIQGGTITAQYSTYYMYIKVNSGTVCDNVVLTPQLEAGSIYTGYEDPHETTNYMIYLEQPLRSLGDVRDCLDCETGKLTRYIYEGRIDGYQDIELKEVDGSTRFVITVPKETTANILFDRKFDYYLVTKGETNSYITIGISDYTTVDDFRSYLKSSPIQYICVMDEPTVEASEIPNIPLTKGTRTIMPRCTGLKPIMDLEYYKN